MLSRYLFLVFVILCGLGCNYNALVDTNQSIEEKKWLYSNPAKASFTVEDLQANHKLNFKLRINADYRYSNMFVLATLKHKKVSQRIRYEFKIAKADGSWLGKGSGDLYTYLLPVFHNHKFADTGTYELTIEQNMRDNPLLGISDIGIEVKKD